MIRRSHQDVGSANSGAFARYLLKAMEIGAAAGSVVGAAACSGIVVVDEGGAGGAGGADVSTSATSTTSTSATASSSTTGGLFECPVAIPSGSELRYGCIGGATPAEGCPPASSPDVFSDLAAQFDGTGCGDWWVNDVPCGPDPTNGVECCYFAVAQELLCGGRPFFVHGVAGVAGTAGRSDWRAAVAPDLTGMDPVTRRSLAASWTKDALDEHASIASFARFTLQLLAASAPADLVATAQRAMGEEIRHAELCFGLAGAYAGRDLGPSALGMAGALEGSSSLGDLVAAAVREGCIGETVAAYLAARSRDAATDAAVHAALEEIAADEAAHAALAWRFVAWALAGGDRGVRRAVADAFAGAMIPMAAPDAEEGTATLLRAHGRLSREERNRAAAICLLEVVAPCARALLARCSIPAGDEREQATAGGSRRGAPDGEEGRPIEALGRRDEHLRTMA